MRRHILLSALAAIAALPLLPGCSGDRGATAPGPPAAASVPSPGTGTQSAAPAGKAEVRIEPADVRKGTPVRVSSEGFPLEGASVEWLVNGAPVAGALDPGKLRKSDTLQARVSGPAGAASTGIVTVKNSPPEVRAVRFLTGDARSEGVLSVETESFDADGDAVQVRFEWKVNGKPAGTGSRPEVPIRRGDKVDVSLTPCDGEECGRTAALTREIRNTPPVITGHERFRMEDGVVSFQVAASDADGDPLKYSLKEAPPGMRIDPAAGRIRWEVPPQTEGKIPFTVAVSDGAGGETSARISITIREEAAPQNPKK